MCGICAVFSLSSDKFSDRCSALKAAVNSCRLQRRGPDKQSYLSQEIIPGIDASFWGFTLHFRGTLSPQPLEDPYGNILLWNGEIFGGIQVDKGQNDGMVLLAELGKCTLDSEVLTVIQRIQGPWAIIYWQVSAQKLWFGRDVFGRRSLLIHVGDDGQCLALSSLCVHESKDWIELPANGLYCMGMSSTSFAHSDTVLYRWKAKGNITETDSSSHPADFNVVYPTLSLSSDLELTVRQGQHKLISSVMSFNTLLPPESVQLLNTVIQETSEECIKELSLTDHATTEHLQLADCFIDVLSEAVRTRIEAQSQLCGVCLENSLSINPYLHAGSVEGHSANRSQEAKDHGQDIEQVKPGFQPDFSSKPCNLEQLDTCGHSRVAILYSGGIDSLVIAALADRFVPECETIDLLNVAFEQKVAQTSVNKCKPGPFPVVNPYDVPDRITGREGLKLLNPARKWNFIEVNVTIDQLQSAREEHIRKLLNPLRTVLDDSIGCAIWFAARGCGEIACEGVHRQVHNSTARVILVGMGADEQLAGYSRHRVKFNTGGWTALVEEIKMEIERISSRNLGRDDRIITDHGKEARFPFLDENVVSFLNALPVWQKANLTLPRGVGEKFLLRLAADKLGLGKAATLPKRAIQFGSRIAKAENRKEKASDVCPRLHNT